MGTIFDARRTAHLIVNPWVSLHRSFATSTWNGTSATRDSATNLMTDPKTATYSWDSRNQLSAVNGGPATAFTAAYDALKRRYDQATAFGGTTTYLHDQSDVAQSTTTNGPSNPLNNYLTMSGTGEVLAFTTTGGTYVPLHDRLGSTIGLVNSANSLQTQYTYEPFGNVTTSGTASIYPYLFAGMELDSSGLYRTQTRYYSPTFGRFLSADAGLSPNPFTYADNDPVDAIDPTGMSPEYVSGAPGVGPVSPDVPIQAMDSSPKGGSLAGAKLADYCAGCGDFAPFPGSGYPGRPPLH